MSNEDIVERERKPFSWKPVVGGALLVGLAGGVIIAEPALKNVLEQATNQTGEPASFDAPMAEIAAADTLLSCVATPQLANGGGSTDSQFTPDTTKQTTGITASVLSDVGARIPGVSATPLTEQASNDSEATAKELTKRIPDEQASQVVSNGADGATTVVGKVLVDDQKTFLKLAAQSLGKQSALISGQRTTLSEDGDLAGFSAAPCMSPSHDQWLVGASTAVENTSILTISNPSSSAATVSVRAYGSTDNEPNVGTLDRLVIAPGEHYTTLLGGVAPDDSAVTLRVQSQGGAVSASIQQSSLRGLTPAGIDYISAGARAATKSVIPFVWVQPQADSTSLGKGSDGQSSASQLMISVPGAVDAKVTAKAIGSDGKSHDIRLPETLKAGRTTAISLAELPAGSYAVRLTSDRSVVASARSVRGKAADQPHDAAYTSSAQRLSQRQLVTLPAGGKPYVLFSTDDAAATVSLRSIDSKGRLGKALEQLIPANSAYMFDPKTLGDVRSFTVDTSGGAVYGGGLSFAGATGITTFAIQPSPTAAQGIPVNLP